MGLMDAFRSMRMKDPVDVEAQVVSVSDAPDGATHGSCVMNLVVHPRGMEAQSIECTSVPAPVKKWPNPGQTLPVTVDRADPSRCKVRWDEVPEWDDIAKQQAAHLAAQMNRGGAGGGQVVMSGGDVDDIVAALQRAMPGAQIDLGGMEPQSPEAAGGSPASGGDDRVAQLERLAELRDKGALTDAEFEREKARILGA